MSLAGAGQRRQPCRGRRRDVPRRFDARRRELADRHEPGHLGHDAVDRRACRGRRVAAETIEPPLREWLIGQQSTREHPFTHAAPGAWAWTPLSGGVPDADDTSGALVASAASRRARRRVGERGGRWRALAAWTCRTATAGFPTFCRGWGALPFDRSTPEITAHALRAWSAWQGHYEPALRSSNPRSAPDARSRISIRAQRPDGSWIPLWFGNEHAPDEDNPVYGTARVLLGLDASLVRDDPKADGCRRRAIAWLLSVQNSDGGWGGAAGVRSSTEETGVVLSALGRISSSADAERITIAVQRGARWLVDAVRDGDPPAPIGLYFARLWYYEDLYPLIFAVDGLAAVSRL